MNPKQALGFRVKGLGNPKNMAGILIGIYPPGPFVLILFLLYSWCSMFDVLIRSLL